MNDFSNLAEWYDKMFSWGTRLPVERSFFSDLFAANGVTRTLDCACGTGMHTILFAALGCDSYGSDLSGEMLRKAVENAVSSGVSPHFRTASFTDLEKTYAREDPFDAVVCLGNSLTLAPSREDVGKALSQMAAVLKTGGLCVLHLFNWDRLPPGQMRIMPATSSIIGGCPTFFLRIFHNTGHHIELHIIILSDEVPHGTRTVTHTAVQQPVGPADLESYARAAGLSVESTYSGYGMEPFDPHLSDQLLCVLRKTGQ